MARRLPRLTFKESGEPGVVLGGYTYLEHYGAQMRNLYCNSLECQGASGRARAEVLCWSVSLGP